MLKRVLPASLLIAAFSMPASASCDLFSEESIMLSKKDCLDLSDGLESFGHNVITIGGLLEEEKPDSSEYWSEWALQTKDAPLITQSIKNNYIGLGAWFPEDLEENQRKMTTEEWLLNHGLQLSIGFGDKKDGEPRMRFDYRWHENQQPDVMMQIELPF